MRHIACLCVLLVSASLIACGPEQSARDQETAINNQFFQKQQATLNAITGDYKGNIIPQTGNPSEKPMPVQMSMRSFTYLVAVPGRVELEQIPTIIGTIRATTSDNIAWNFNQGQYNPETHALSLMGPAQSTLSFVYFNGQVDGNTITGEMFTTTRTLRLVLTRDNSNKPK